MRAASPASCGSGFPMDARDGFGFTGWRSPDSPAKTWEWRAGAPLPAARPSRGPTRSAEVEGRRTVACTGQGEGRDALVHAVYGRTWNDCAPSKPLRPHKPPPGRAERLPADCMRARATAASNAPGPKRQIAGFHACPVRQRPAARTGRLVRCEASPVAGRERQRPRASVSAVGTTTTSSCDRSGERGVAGALPGNRPADAEGPGAPIAAPRENGPDLPRTPSQRDPRASRSSVLS